MKILDKCVKQTIEEMNSSVRCFKPYIPIGEAVKKLQEWHNQYTTCIYLSSHKKILGTEKDRDILQKNHFSFRGSMYRKENEKYLSIKANFLLAIIIEDICGSI